MTGKRSNQEMEGWLVNAFLEFMSRKVLRLYLSDRPDVVATVSKCATTEDIAIEVVVYYHDRDSSEGRGSPGAGLYDWWCAVKDEIRGRASHVLELRRMYGRVSLKSDAPPPKRSVRAVADELVKLATEQAVSDGDTVRVREFEDGFPTLLKYVQRVDLVGRDPYLSGGWRCHNAVASNVGVNPRIVANYIREKAEKAGGYTWPTDAERWLLICADGDTVFSAGGPHPELVEWNDPGVVEACSNTPFDRIFFWERTRKWCKPIWPDGSLITK